MPERTCPSCKQTMATGRLGPIELDLCIPCGGVWFDCGELSQIISAGPHILRRLCSRIPPPAGAPPARKLELPKCPVCHAGMDGTEYASMPGVSMDSCSFCEGVWASHKALERLAAALEGAPTVEQIAAGTARPFSAAVPAAGGLGATGAGSPGFPAAAPQESTLCPACGEPNSPRAAACWACGKPLLGAAVGHCPACRATMRRLDSQGVTFNACEGCGGLFTNPARFNMLLRQPAEQLEVAVLKQLERLGSGSGLRPGLIPSCPECGVGMVLSPLGRLSPRPIPACPRCFALFLSRDMVGEILLDKRAGQQPQRPAGAAVPELTREAALERGLEELLKRARLVQGWRGVLGFSAGTGRSYHAIRFENTGQVVILLLPDRPGSAADVATVPADIRWEI